MVQDGGSEVWAVWAVWALVWVTFAWWTALYLVGFSGRIPPVGVGRIGFVKRAKAWDAEPTELNR